MSKLRKQLQQSKRDYESLRYPGDLSADVQGRLTAIANPSRWIRNLAIAAGLALAATALIVVMRQSGPANIAEDQPTTRTDQETRVAVDDGGPTMPEGVTPVSRDQTAVATDDSGDETDLEESWTLVPGEVAVAQEMAVSFVPSFQAMSFSVPSASISSIDSYAEQEETQIEVQ